MRLKLLIGSLIAFLVLQLEPANAQVAGEVGILVMCPSQVPARLAIEPKTGSLDDQNALQGWGESGGESAEAPFSLATVQGGPGPLLMCSYSLFGANRLWISQAVPQGMTCSVDHTNPALFVCSTLLSLSPLYKSFNSTVTSGVTTTP
jgi:hypothetical protein